MSATSRASVEPEAAPQLGLGIDAGYYALPAGTILEVRSSRGHHAAARIAARAIAANRENPLGKIE